MLSDEQFKRARELALSIAGIELVERHRDLLHSRSRRQGFTGAALDNLLTAAERYDPNATQQLIGLLTTKHTGFFRHPLHFKIAAEHARRMVELRGRAALWSCGAATGEEPYSLAIGLIELFNRDDPPVSILATDVDVNSLMRAESYVYPESIANVDASRRARFFESNVESKTISVAPAVRRLLTFKTLNLAAPTWNISGQFDVIFCRNVIMYMESGRRAQVIEKILRHMAPEALFIIDPVENLGAMSPLFYQHEPGVYAFRANSGDRS